MNARSRPDKAGAGEPGAQYLRVPLAAGGAVGHWRLGRAYEERFDVPDQPMHGEMDPFFFLAKVKNFIPHEYPCRTAFAARYRGRHPAPTIGFEPAGWSFPFGSPRVDISGFWFRPTRIECWAGTGIHAGKVQRARFRFATCGGALLKVNGREVAALSGYQRNLEEAVEAEVELAAGHNTLSVWFGDLCERDTRFYFELTLLGGEGLSVAVPVETEPERASEIERLLAGIRFERPSYGAGEVAVLLPEPASADYEAARSVTGDFISPEAVAAPLRLGRGDTRLALGTVATLPADFRHVTITLRHGDFVLSRVLGVEICDLPAQGEPGPTIEARAAEALRHVADYAESDPVRALACLAVGDSGPETDRMLESSLPAIRDCYDCADFLLVPLLWCRSAYPDAIGPATREAIDDAVLGFRYWMDEPGNDVMWYFSENHTLLFHTAAYLAGALLPDARFRRSGRTGREQSAVGRKRLLDWLDHFETHEMAEWNSAPYFPIDLKGLAALFALAPDADIRARAERAMLRLLQIVALSSHGGMLTASQGRSYEHSLRPARTLELSAIARLFFGRGWQGRRFHALPQLALAVRDHGFAVDPRLAELALWSGEDALEWTFLQGPDGIAALYHHKTRDHAMGSIAGYRTGEWGYQETVLHLRLGERPEAQIWINHPGERILSGHARPSYWGGCGTLPRVHQYRDLAVIDFALRPEQVDFSHAWLPEAEMDEVRHAGNRVLVRAGNALALLIGSAAFQRVTEGPTAGCEIRLAGARSRWLVRLSDIAREGSLEAFAERFAGLRSSDAEDGTLHLDDPDYGPVLCRSDGTIAAEGRDVDPAQWTHSGQALLLPGGRVFSLPYDGPKEQSSRINAQTRTD